MQIQLTSGQTVDSQHVEWYVLGASYEYLTRTGQIHLRDNIDEFNPFKQRVLEKVIAYLRGKSLLTLPTVISSALSQPSSINS